MDVDVELGDLVTVQPRLEWREMTIAAALVLGVGRSPPFEFPVEIVDVPGTELSQLRFRIGMTGMDAHQLHRLRRTYELPRLVETAAIALAALALYHAGEHALTRVSDENPVGDYLVDDGGHLLEVAGRSRRRDFEYAYKQRQRRLTQALGGGFYVFVAEFQTPRGRLSFHS